MQKLLGSNVCEVAVCLESNVIAATEKPSDEAVDCLRAISTFFGNKVEFVMSRSDWIPRYPKLDQLLADAERGRLIDLIPYDKAGEDEAGNCLMWTVRVLPGAVEILKEPRKVHRQVTIDDQKIDLRTMVGRMICTSSIVNLADTCRLWLADLALETDPKARRKARILLERTIGFRGQDLAGYDPTLKQEVMDRLTAPSSYLSKRTRRRQGKESP